MGRICTSRSHKSVLLYHLLGNGVKHCHFSGNNTATRFENGNFPFLSTPHRIYGGRLTKNENPEV